jgi:hypothetical protein
MLELVRYLRTSTVMLPEARFAGWECPVGVAVERQDIDVLEHSKTLFDNDDQLL